MQLVFELGGDTTLVKIIGDNVLFSNSSTNFQQFAPIDGLRLSSAGIIKEHPDLKGLPAGEMRQEAIKRFKELVKKLETTNQVKNYVTKELEMFGWKLKSVQQKGFRTMKIK